MGYDRVFIWIIWRKELLEKMFMQKERGKKRHLWCADLHSFMKYHSKQRGISSYQNDQLSTKWTLYTHMRRRDLSLHFLWGFRDLYVREPGLDHWRLYVELIYTPIKQHPGALLQLFAVSHFNTKDICVKLSDWLRCNALVICVRVSLDI